MSSLVVQERFSDSPYIDKVMIGHTLHSESVVRPSEIHWHMVWVRQEGITRVLVVGPWSSAGPTGWSAGAEILWIKFRLGTFMPHLPVQALRDRETVLPETVGGAFWLNGSTWEVPTFENADTFASRLVRAQILTHDSLIDASVGEALPTRMPPADLASRTVRHRFLRATGLTQSHIRQYQRAQRAAALLQQGMPILDVVFESGYFDQPHLTRELKRFTGRTPAQHLPDPLQHP